MMACFGILWMGQFWHLSNEVRDVVKCREKEVECEANVLFCVQTFHNYVMRKDGIRIKTMVTKYKNWKTKSCFAWKWLSKRRNESAKEKFYLDNAKRLFWINERVYFFKKMNITRTNTANGQCKKRSMLVFSSTVSYSDVVYLFSIVNSCAARRWPELTLYEWERWHQASWYMKRAMDESGCVLLWNGRQYRLSSVLAGFNHTCLFFDHHLN